MPSLRLGATAAAHAGPSWSQCLTVIMFSKCNLIALILGNNMLFQDLSSSACMRIDHAK